MPDCEAPDRQSLAAAVDDVTLAELQATYKNLLRGNKRKRLVVRATGRQQEDTVTTAGEVSEENIILNAPGFKQEKGFFSG